MKMWIRQEDGSVVVDQPLNVPGKNISYPCCGSFGSSGYSKCQAYEDNYRAKFGTDVKDLVL
jgi:hypothetical protein